MAHPTLVKTFRTSEMFLYKPCDTPPASTSFVSAAVVEIFYSMKTEPLINYVVL